MANFFHLPTSTHWDTSRQQSTGDGKPAPIAGWNEVEREQLQAIIADRQPFLDFKFSRANADGSTQQFRVSGEPMFNKSSRFIGYRGIGVETTSE